MNELLDNYIEKHFNDIKNALSRLVQHPSISGEREGTFPFGRGCAKALDELLQIASELGFKTKNYDYYLGTVDYGEEPSLAILGHLDVVPVCADDWETPPFELSERNGCFFGRGAIDDKGPVISALFAMKAIKESGIKLSQGVRLILGCTEETGTEADLKHYLKYEKMPERVFTPDGDFPVITTEKAMIHFSFSRSLDQSKMNIVSLNGGSVVNAVPSSATALVRNIHRFPKYEHITAIETNNGYEITAHGVPSHASKPAEGRNAITLLLSYLSLLSLSDYDKAFVKSLSDTFPHGESDGASIGIKADENEYATTCIFSIAELKNGVFIGQSDVRCGISLKSAEACNRIKTKFSEYNLSFDYISEAHIVDPKCDFVQTLLSAYTDVTGFKPFCRTIGGGTYVHNIENGVAFGMEFPGDNNNMHAANEFVKANDLKLSTKVYAEAILQLCK